MTKSSKKRTTAAGRSRAKPARRVETDTFGPIEVPTDK